jgi:hypothetical protein
MACRTRLDIEPIHTHNQTRIGMKGELYLMNSLYIVNSHQQYAACLLFPLGIRRLAWRAGSQVRYHSFLVTTSTT